MKRDSRGKKRSYFSLFKFFYSVYVVCIGNHITSRAIWDKSAQVIFFKTNQIAQACILFQPSALFGINCHSNRYCTDKKCAIFWSLLLLLLSWTTAFKSLIYYKNCHVVSKFWAKSEPITLEYPSQSSRN